METIIRNLVEYEGIDKVFIHGENNPFKSMVFEISEELPVGKADIIQITKASIECSVIDSKVIKTPSGTSISGLKLTGRKLFITGDIKIKIQYLTDDKNQLVNTFIVKTAYAGSVILPYKTHEKSYIAAGVLVEDFFVKEMDSRTFYLNINLIMIASIC